MLRIQGIAAERVDSVHIHHILQILIIPGLDLLNLMGGTESVEEVDERNLSLDGCAVCNRGQVHNLLYAGLAEHRCSGLTAGVHIGVISEDGQRVACKSTGRYVKYARQLLAGYFVEVRNHQQQTLGCRKGSRQSAGCQRAVYSACGSCLRLHLGYLYGLSEDVLSSLCGPLICGFRHNG